MHDSSSAEVYCTLGGDVVPPRTAQSIGERHNLHAWSALCVPAAPSGSGKGPIALAMSREKTVDEALKRELIKVLLEVYMTGGSVVSFRGCMATESASTGSTCRTVRRSCSTRKP